MASIVFIRGTTDPFLTALGVPYGQIVIEGCDPCEVLCISTARSALREARRQGLITEDQAAGLEREVRSVGLLEDLRGVCHHLGRRHSLPNGLERVLRYEPVTDTALARAMHFGQIKTSTGRELGSVIMTLERGIRVCREIHKEGWARIFDLCALLLDMAATDIATDNTDAQMRRENLPQDIRLAIEEEDQRGRAQLRRFWQVPFASCGDDNDE